MAAGWGGTIGLGHPMPGTGQAPRAASRWIRSSAGLVRGVLRRGAMTPIVHSFKRVWLCAMRRLRPFVSDFVDGLLTPHRVELLKKIYVHDVNGGIFQSMLVEEFKVHKSSISRMLSKMERDGFIQRHYVIEQPGHKFVELTERGRAIIDVLRALWHDHNQPHAQVANAFLGPRAESVDYRPLYRVLNGIRIRLDDDAPFLQPWRLRDLWKNVGPFDGLLGHYVRCRLEPDDFDDFVEGEYED